MTRNDIIEWVVNKIDEVLPGGENLQGETAIEAPIGFIDEELDSSARHVLLIAPDDMVMSAIKAGVNHNQTGTAVPSRLIINQDLTAKYVLPTDFLRFVDIKLDSWARSVPEVIDYKDPKYINQVNRFRRGDWRKPKAVLAPFKEYVANEVIANEPNVNYCLELYSAKASGDVVERFYYVPRLKAEDVPQDLIDPVAWICASRALQILKRPEESQLAMQRAEMQLNMFNLGKEGERFRTAGR
jgi:hypothetical protein